MSEEQVKAIAFMAFAKGACVMGNRDIGTVEGYGKRGIAVFNEWWARYGASDYRRACAEAKADRESADR